MRKITFWLLFSIVAISSHLNAQVESFETTAVGSVPNGWVKYQSESDDPGFQVMDQTGYAHDGTKYLAHEGVDLAAESTSWVVTNVIHVGNAYELTFYWRGRWTSAYNFSGAYISTGSNDPVANPGDFTLLEEYSPANFPSTWLQWNKAMYDLSSYANQDIYIAFKYIGDHAHDFFIDEVNVAPVPYCELPDNLDVVGRGMDYLDIDWDPALGVTDYEVVWGAPGFDPNAAGNSPVLVSNATNYQITGLTQSTTYEVYVRSVCSSYNFSPWVGPVTGITSGPPPANDDCDNAIGLTVNSDLNCANVTHGTTLDATASPQPDDVTGTPNNDVWFSFVATQSTHKISLLNVVAVMGTSTDMGMGLYDGSGGCSALTLVDDSDPNDMIAGGLVAGNTYYLRVYGWSSSLNSAQEFDVCVGTPPPPPANDECSAAIDLTVYDYGTSTGNETPGDTSFATDSNMHPSCDDTGTNLDLWYTFTVPSGATDILVKTGGANGSDIEAALYDSCGGTQIDCQNNGSTKLFYGLTSGTTYTLQIWHDDFNAGEFTIAVEKAPGAPANDECSGAIDLTVYDFGASTGNETPGDTSFATDSNMHPSCDDTGTNLDLWYTFTVPAGTTGVIVKTGGANGSDIEAALYDSCGGTQIDCQNNGSTKLFYGLTSGTTYTLQIWHDDFNAGEFTIAVEKAPAAPANDECSGAIDLTVYDFGASTGNETPGDTSFATDSNMHPSCDDSGTNLDLWYTFTVPAGSTSVIVKTGGANGDQIEAALYDNCGGAELDCQNNGSAKLFSGLTAGTTYTLQVWHDDFNAGEFNIAVEKVSSSTPGNDDCDNAESLTVNPDDMCGVVTHGTTFNATASSQPDDVTGTPNNDVWYTFVATNTSHIIKLLNVTAVIGSSTDMGMGLYDGTNGCANLSLVQDSDPNTMMVGGLTVGTTYYLRVYGWSSSTTAQEFDVCVGTPPPPPTNDDCANAIPLTVTNSCSPVNASNFSASDSGVPDPGCASYSGGDVWFSFQVPASGSATVETSEVTGSDLHDTGMAVYEGNCGSLNLIDCNDDGGTSLFSKIVLTGRTPGETLYVRVWEYGNNSFGPFGVCVYDASVSLAENKIEGLKFYPNPVTNILNIQANENIQAVYIYDISGQEVMVSKPNAVKQQIDMSHLTNGLYFVKVQVEGQFSAFKVAKK